MNERNKEQEPIGIACPRCGCRHFLTTNTEPLRNGRIRRRKTCRHCGRRIVTFEATVAMAERDDCYI
jgi:transcriptional regulator NrdR family protein